MKRLPAPHSASTPSAMPCSRQRQAQGLTWGLAIAAALLSTAQAASPADLPLQLVKLPPGFEIRLYSNASVPNARNLALGLARDDATIVYVSSDQAGGAVTALLDRGKDGFAEEPPCQVLTGLDRPNGIVWHNGSLYVAEVTKITRFEGADFKVLNGCNGSLTMTTVLTSDLPNQSTHTSRALGLSPEGRLLVSVAASFNVGDCRDLFCSIQSLDPSGSGQLEPFATGIRNVGGFAWHPTGAVRGAFFTVLERDWLGDDAPDDALFSAAQPGLNFQFPYCHWVGLGSPEQRAPAPGIPLADPDTVPVWAAITDGQSHNDSFGRLCGERAPPPVQPLGPHVSPLGLTFYPPTPESLPQREGFTHAPKMWPDGYRGQLFVAEHGSWNRAQPLGYSIAQVQVSPDGRPQNHSIFASGWLQDDNNTHWGRPVGLLVMPDGSMLVAGDQEGAVYRITYEDG